MYFHLSLYTVICLLQVFLPTSIESKIFMAIVVGFMNVIGLLEKKYQK